MIGKAFTTSITNHAKGEVTDLIISGEYLCRADQVLLIDYFLATGQTIERLPHLVDKAKASLLGIGCVIEKTFEGVRKRFTFLGVPVVNLVRITPMDAGKIELGP
jgi:xanthine phosphoribosyltransferase